MVLSKRSNRHTAVVSLAALSQSKYSKTERLWYAWVILIVRWGHVVSGFNWHCNNKAVSLFISVSQVNVNGESSLKVIRI